MYVTITVIFSHGDGKANSVQEACANCFAVHILKFEIMQINENMKLLVFSFSSINLTF
jgi:hypothetical protein